MARLAVNTSLGRVASRPERQLGREQPVGATRGDGEMLEGGIASSGGNTREGSRCEEICQRRHSAAVAACRAVRADRSLMEVENVSQTNNQSHGRKPDSSFPDP